MTNIDFVRDGRVGDEVWDPRFGNGEILHISKNNLVFPIEISFCDYRRSYTSDGKLPQDGRALLCWGHRNGINQGQPPKREPEFEYPLIMRSKHTGEAWKFSSLSRGIQITGFDIIPQELNLRSHTNTDHWEPWTLDRPTWCEVWEGNRVHTKIRLIVGAIKYNFGVRFRDCHDGSWEHAEPCNSPVFDCGGKKWRIVAEEIDG